MSLVGLVGREEYPTASSNDRSTSGRSWGPESLTLRNRSSLDDDISVHARRLTWQAPQNDSGCCATATGLVTLKP